MQTADLVLAIAVPLVALCAGWVGVEMSLTPPDRLTPTKCNWYRAVFVILMLAAIALNIWQTARNAEQQEKAREDSQRTQGQLTNKVSEQGGKLDAIAHFEQQFLSFVSQERQHGTPDAAAKAYEAMALTVMKMAQSGPTNAQDSAHVEVLCNGRELNGQTLTVAVGPNNVFTLPEFQFKNTGGHASGTVSVRLYLSEQVNNPVPLWEPTTSDEADYPRAFYIGGPFNIINPAETFNWTPFSATLPAGIHSSSAKLKVFYGAPKPTEANFSVRFTGKTP